MSRSSLDGDQSMILSAPLVLRDYGPTYKSAHAFVRVKINKSSRIQPPFELSS